MSSSWKVTNKQWKQISKHLPDSRATVSDRTCFETLLYRTFTEGNIRDLTTTKLSDDHPSNGTFYNRVNQWKEEGVLSKLAHAYGQTLTPRQRNRFRDVLYQTKASWRAEFLDVIRPAKVKK